MLRESIRRMLERHAPREQMAKWDEEDRVPRALMDQIRDLGVCGMTVPEEYGGIGRDVLATMVTVEELSRRSMVIGTLYLMNACYGSMNILASGSEEQKQRLLPRLANGELLFAYGLSEPDVGFGSRQRLDPRRAPRRQGRSSTATSAGARAPRSPTTSTRSSAPASRTRDTRTCRSCSFRRPPRA